MHALWYEEMHRKYIFFSMGSVRFQPIICFHLTKTIFNRYIVLYVSYTVI